ncbi:MAG: hypothetical protein Q8807_03050 ['Waltheria sp.' little leaf phytoplasma]|nr:hypothetical protein ['Waltheria sp.' little leaf phytoplasma]
MSEFDLPEDGGVAATRLRATTAGPTAFSWGVIDTLLAALLVCGLLIVAGVVVAVVAAAS